MLNLNHLPDDILSKINSESLCQLNIFQNYNLCHCNKYFQKNLYQKPLCFIIVHIDLHNNNYNINLICKNHPKNKLSLNLFYINIYFILNYYLIIYFSIEILRLLILIENKKIFKFLINLIIKLFEVKIVLMKMLKY